MFSVPQTAPEVQPTFDPEYAEWLDALGRGHYEDEPPTDESPDFEPSEEDRAWLADNDYGDDEDFSDVRESFKTIEDWDDLPTLTQDDKDRIEDEVMGHLEDFDARREWIGGVR